MPSPSYITTDSQSASLSWRQAPICDLRIFSHLSLIIFRQLRVCCDSLCDLVVRVLGYRSGGPGSIPGTTRKEKVVGLELGPLSLVSTTEELLDRKVAATV
jgi:hypothetical protein